MDNALASQLAFAYISAHLLQWLKNSPAFPLMQKDAVYLNRFFSAVFAFLVSLGINTVHTWAVSSDGSHVLTITMAIPAWNILFQHLWEWGQQYVFQDGVFRFFIKDSNERKQNDEKVNRSSTDSSTTTH